MDEECKQCPDGLSTPGRGSTSAADCTGMLVKLNSVFALFKFEQREHLFLYVTNTDAGHGTR